MGWLVHRALWTPRGIRSLGSRGEKLKQRVRKATEVTLRPFQGLGADNSFKTLKMAFDPA